MSICAEVTLKAIQTFLFPTLLFSLTLISEKKKNVQLFFSGSSDASQWKENPPRSVWIIYEGSFSGDPFNTDTHSLPSMTQSSEVDEEIPPNPPCLTGSQSKEGRVAP